MSMISLSKPLESFGFVERERRNGKQLHFKCERDFLYFCLNFYFPEKFNASVGNPEEIDRKQLFGMPVPKYFAWTQIQYFNMPAFFRKQGLTLYINNWKINSYWDLMSAVLFSRLPLDEAMQSLENNIKNNVACAIDIPIEKKKFVLLDHVMFVYGYDNENVYVFDTLTVPGLAYERVRDDIHYFKLPRGVIEKNWCLFGRVWRVEKN